MKRFLYFLMTFLLLAQSALNGHGFAGNTPVIVKSSLPGGKGSWSRIKSIYECDRCRDNIATYDFRNRKERFITVGVAGEGNTNCYMKITTNNGYFDEVLHCSPTQKFDVPKNKKWVQAFNLNVGDKLFTVWGTQIPVTKIEFVKEPLKLYTLEVDKTHCYFVGRHGVLAHNVALPLLSVTLTWYWGEGAAAGAAAGETVGGTPGLAVGAVVGGVIGVGIYGIGYYGKRLFDINFDADKFGERFESKRGYNREQDSWYGEYDYEQKNQNDGNSGQTPGTSGNDDGQFTPPPDDEGPNKKGKGSTNPPPPNEGDKEGRRKHYDQQTDRGLKRSKKSIEENIKEHTQKNDAFRQNPEAHDNQGLLKNAKSDAIREQIKNNRPDKVDREIGRFEIDLQIIEELMKKRGIK